VTVRDTTATPAPKLWARAVKAAVVVACGVLPAIGVGMMIVSSLLDDDYGLRDVPQLISYAAFLVGPGALYAALIRRGLPILFAGVPLLALETWCVWVVYTDDSSTAPLVLLWVPFFGFPLVAVTALIQAWSRPDP
jgi:hypothetical protein